MKSSVSIHRGVRPLVVLALVMVAMLCAATPSRAEVVYKNMYVQIVNTGTYNYDFNGDGATDLNLALNLQTNSCGYVITAAETPAQGNGAEGEPLTPLQAGDQIGPNQPFSAGAGTIASLSWNYCSHKVIYGGPWPQSAVRYLGVSFVIDGETHYAWASVEFEVILTFGPPKLRAILTGYAYETVPGMPINAGQTK